MTQAAARLGEHLRHQLGAWPPPGPGVAVAGSPRREQPGWDGRVRRLAGMLTPYGSIVSVAPDLVGAIREALRDKDSDAAIARAIGYPASDGRRLVTAHGPVFRSTTSPTATPDTGEWVATDDPRVPPWLRPFDGGVLCAWGADGEYVAGVGVKAHDEFGHELAVGTEPAARGRGLARLLVATAARRVLDEGAAPTYVHQPGNLASAHVADAAGFPDEGLRVIGFWPARSAEPES